MSENLNWSDAEKSYACPHCGEKGYQALLWNCCETSRAEYEALTTDYESSAAPPLVVSYRTAKLLKELFNIGDVNASTTDETE